MSELLLSLSGRSNGLLYAFRNLDFDFAALSSHHCFSRNTLLVFGKLSEELPIDRSGRVRKDLAPAFGDFIDAILILEQLGHAELARGPVYKNGEHIPVSARREFC